MRAVALKSIHGADRGGGEGLARGSAVNGSPAWHMIFLIIPSIIGALLCLVLLFVLMQKPSRLLLFFLCFYLIGVFHLAGALIAPHVAKSASAFGIQGYWEIGLAISRLRYIFLIYFAHSVHRFRLTPALTALMTAIVGLGIACPFFVYSIIPNLMEIAVVLYVFVYWLAVYLLRNRLSVSPSLQGLLRAVLACSGFFLIGVILDLLEDIPQASAYVSILLVDFYPVYLLSIGVAFAFWAVRDLYHPISPRGQKAGSIDFSRLPVTKREREIIGLVLRGETNASIAERLFISESTVKKHLNNLFRKLRISSRWELLKLTENSPPRE
jgi:DNA-binding CsgD family transcriptional regulator